MEWITRAEQFALLGVIAGVVSMVYVLWRVLWINRQDAGTERMQRIASYIAEGAVAFLRAEYRVLVLFVLVVGVVLALAVSRQGTSLIALSFLVGALCSGLAGYVGMKVATRANVRTANAARTSLNKALRVAFVGGSVMGMGVVGFGLLGIGILLLIYLKVFGGQSPEQLHQVVEVLTGFSFGASSIALFARVGGGIYTKGADVGADLVGKVEAGIPEDHPLNPAVIADNVGDNVGDVAGMGADLFESYVGSIISAMVVGVSVWLMSPAAGYAIVFLPVLLAGIGILASLIGTFFVQVKEGGNPQVGLNIGQFVAGLLFMLLSFLVVRWLLGDTSVQVWGKHITGMDVWLAVVVGLLAGILIGLLTEYYTSPWRPYTTRIVRRSLAGVGPNIITGLEVGMGSTAVPVLVLAAATLIVYWLAGLYGVALAAVGMLANTGIQLATDAYGPIADNAGGITEMAGLGAEVRARTDKLDAVGNTTAAIGKGFAIGSAALTALAFFSAYTQAAGLSETGINLSDPLVIAGLLLGGVMPFFFSSLAIGAVGHSAMAMVEEVRRQFTQIEPLKRAVEKLKTFFEKGEKIPPDVHKELEEAEKYVEYARCVEIATRSALRRMLAPGLTAVVVPVVVGLAGGKKMLGGLLMGALVTAVLLALFQANTGAAWDNAKKMVEEGFEYEGKLYKKGSDLHKATVVGDTVGDPLKDTAGPSLNILIKLMSIIALILAPLLAG